MKPNSIFILVVAIATLSSHASAQKPAKKSEEVSFLVAPSPAWVKPLAMPDQLAPNQESAGTYFLLVDRQVNVDRRAFYYHDIRKITSEDGVQSGTSVSVSFNPAFERLSLHTLRVIRNNVSSD